MPPHTPADTKSSAATAAAKCPDTRCVALNAQRIRKPLPCPSTPSAGRFAASGQRSPASVSIGLRLPNRAHPCTRLLIPALFLPNTALYGADGSCRRSRRSWNLWPFHSLSPSTVLHLANQQHHCIPCHLKNTLVPAHAAINVFLKK